MQQKNVVACASALVLALALACSKSPQTPVSPSAAQPGTSDAGPAGETLKASAPSPQSPINNAQPTQLTFTSGKSTGTFDQGLANSYAYEFQVLNSANATICTATVPGGSGSSVSWSPTNCTLAFDQPHAWRVRATYQGAAGPWSANATFRSPIGGYIRGNELYDPLYNGVTVGQPVNTTFVPGQGIKLIGHDSRVTYALPETLQAGEFSLMVLNADEGSPGDKTKIMSMQEGFGPITDNDYRVTIEKRGRDYPIPGAIQFRMITGDARHEGNIFDSARVGVVFDRSKWYFWKFTWRTGRADLVVREDGPNGRILYNAGRGTGDHPYRPEVHVLHLGAPSSRAGLQDASVPDTTYKNVWVSPNPRPALPGE